MNRRFILILSLFCLTSCGVRKDTIGTSREVSISKKVSYAQIPDLVQIDENNVEGLEEKPFNIIEHALQFLGTKYKYGGTTPEGMDCSGLVYTCFSQQDIALPRSSKEMALLGEELDLEKVKIGDLLFFKTDRRKKDINHVGLVVQLDPDNIFFIHSSTSRGVIISALKENYWRETFVMARRVL